jgi:hypothetical protein
MAKTYTKWENFERDFKNQNLKFAKLQDQSGADLVSFNSPMLKHKTTLTAKLSEIKKKISALEDGLYIILGQHRFGKNISPVKFYFSKNFSGTIEEKEPEEKKQSSTDKLLSVDAAMTNVKEAATLKAENLFLKRENEDLKKRIDLAEGKISDQEQKISELEESLEETEGAEVTPSNPFSGLGDMFKEMVPVLSPIADRYFDLRDKELQMKQAKFLHDGGYDIPGFKKANGKPATKQKMKEIPQPGAEGWDEFISYMEGLNEKDFNEAMERLKPYPNILEAAEAELMEDEPEEQEESEEQEETK